MASKALAPVLDAFGETPVGEMHRPRPDDVRTPAGTAAADSVAEYTLRFAPRRFRRWSPSGVANSALGGIAYLADFAIGASIALDHGTHSALLGIVCAAIIIFLTGYPLAYFACR